MTRMTALPQRLQEAEPDKRVSCTDNCHVLKDMTTLQHTVQLDRLTMLVSSHTHNPTFISPVYWVRDSTKRCLFWKGLPLYSNVDFSGGVVEGVEPALHKKSPLKTERGDQEVEAHAAEAVAFQEGHEETESNKDHDVDVLETWREDNRHNLHLSIEYEVQWIIQISFFSPSLLISTWH